MEEEEPKGAALSPLHTYYGLPVSVFMGFLSMQMSESLILGPFLVLFPTGLNNYSTFKSVTFHSASTVKLFFF